jgi:hypothetical protein
MRRALILLVLLPLSLACRNAPQPAPAATGSPAPSPTSAPSEPAAIKPMPAQLPAVLAKVNGEPIERWEIENGVRRVEARAGSPMPPDKRDAVLRSVQLRRQARTDLEISKLLDAEVNAKVSVQDGDVDAFYEQNADRFKEGETVHASHILLGDSKLEQFVTQAKATSKVEILV